jgi:NTE family protein
LAPLDESVLREYRVHAHHQPVLLPLSRAGSVEELAGEEHVDFGRINDLVKQSSPLLLAGAANVLSGGLKAFSSHRDKINADMLLASAAIPTLFRTVHTDGGVYWDGLFSQNPPCASFPMQNRNRTRSG